MTAPGSVLAQALDQAVEQIELEKAARAGERERLTRRQRYALDPLAWIDDGHVRILDEVGRVIVMRAFDHQREFVTTWVDVDHLQATGQLRFRNLAEEKTRQMGLTWIAAYVICWAVTFHNGRGLAIHINGAEVDDGGPNNTVESIFGKVRFIHEHLPPEALPGRLVFEAASGNRRARIRNLDRPAICVGAKATANPGRGGTFLYVLGDEMAFVPWGERAHSSLSRACPNGKAYLSTAHGTDNVHYRMVSQRPTGWTILRHHWSQHPVYGQGVHVAGEQPEKCELCAQGRHRFPGRLTSPWYEAAIEELTDEQVAQELDIDYEGSLPGRVYAEWQSDRHVWHEPISLDPQLEVHLGWDYGMDCTSVVICQDAPSEYRVVGEYEASGQTPDQVAAGVREALLAKGWPAHLIEARWTRRMRAVGDPSGEARQLATGRPLVYDYAQHGFVITSTPRSVDATIVAVKRILRGRPKPLVVSPDCELFIQHIRNNRWPTDKTGRRRAGPPQDDEHNHMMRAFAYLVADRFPPPTAPAEPSLPEDRPRDGLIDDGLSYDMAL